MPEVRLDQPSVFSGRWTVAIAIAVYLLWIAILGPRSVGLEYDEALLLHGAVHMLNSSAEPAFAHDWGSWLRFGGRFWPLTVIPYMGAVKDYLALIPFVLFGTDLLVIRGLSAILGAFGILGIARLLQSQIGTHVGGAVALVLAMHPAYLLYTTYDKDAFGLWMASLGLLCLMMRTYLARRSTLSAICLGLAMGIAVWGRLNFLWLLGAALLGGLIVFRRRLIVPVRHVLAITAGAIIGSLPMLIYQYRSRGGAVRFMTEHEPRLDVASRVIERLKVLSDTLLINSENRAMWGVPTERPALSYTLALIVAVALVHCLIARDSDEPRVRDWKRTSSLTFIFLATFMLLSGLPVSGHHLVTLIPIAALMVVLMLRSASRWKRGVHLVALISLFYISSATAWNVIAARGLRSTGGVRTWSDQILKLTEHIEARYHDQEVKILDWGFQNNLFVLSNARITSRELFWGATSEVTGFKRSWDEEVSEGGVFLIRSPGNRIFPGPTDGFERALRDSRRTYERTQFAQRNGVAWAEIIEIPRQ